MNDIWTQVQIDVAVVKEVVLEQKDTLRGINEKLGEALFREEYERRHAELKKEIESVKQELSTTRSEAAQARAETRDVRVAARTWRFVVVTAITILGIVIALLRH